jgi:formate hydrogenlyase transcriptional activator
LDFSTNESFIEQGHVGSVTWSPSCVAIETGKQAIFREKDLQEMSAISEIARRLLANGLKSFCSVPLMSHNRTMGALNIGRRGGDGFTTEDIELLSQVAQQIALAVENAVAYKEIARQGCWRASCSVTKKARYRRHRDEGRSIRISRPWNLAPR